MLSFLELAGDAAFAPPGDGVARKVPEESQISADDHHVLTFSTSQHQRETPPPAGQIPAPLATGQFDKLPALLRKKLASDPDVLSRKERLKQRLCKRWGETLLDIISTREEGTRDLRNAAGKWWQALRTFADCRLQGGVGSMELMRGVAGLHVLDFLLSFDSELQVRFPKDRKRKRPQLSIESGELEIGPSLDELDAIGRVGGMDTAFRSKVLILCPTRSVAAIYTQLLSQLYASENSIENLEAFVESFGGPDTPGPFAPTEAGANSLHTGNSDSRFLTGVRVLSNNKLVLDCKLSASDILIASPLGLENWFESRPESNLLSSIHLLIVDSSGVLLLQHPLLMLDVLPRLNKIAAARKGLVPFDISRLLPSLIHEELGTLRQNIFLSAGHPTLEAGALLDFFCQNCRGSFDLTLRTPPLLLRDIKRNTKKHQTICQEMPLPEEVDPEAIGELSLKFLAGLLPQLAETAGAGARVLLVLPSEIEFLQLRRLAKDRDIPLETAWERQSKTQKRDATRKFRDGHSPLMMTTERSLAHEVKNLTNCAATIVLLHPPALPEVVNRLLNAQTDLALVLLLFHRLHLPHMGPLLGETAVEKMSTECSRGGRSSVFVLP